MSRISIIAAALFAALAVQAPDALAAGLTVEPGGLLIQDIPIGEARSVVEASGISFVVYNRDEIGHSYVVSAHRPSRAGNGAWPSGYCEIPDASWIRPVPETLTIPPGSSAVFDLEIEVPDDAHLYNQKWAATLSIESVPVPGVNVALALYPCIQIETVAREGAQARPLGAIAVAPAVLRANAAQEPLAFEVYNNDTVPHGYLIQVGSSGGKIPGSPGLTAAEQNHYLIPRSERLWVEAGGKGTVLLDIDPETVKRRPDFWEQLVFVRSESGDCTFVRCQMIPE
jgi:hypothetical protein